MPLATHRSHTFDMDAIKPGDWVIDAGCRDLTLARDFAERGVNVIAIDADPELHKHTFPDSPLVRVLPGVALVGRDFIARNKTRVADLDVSGNEYGFSLHTCNSGPRRRTQLKTIDEILLMHQLDRVALLKLDIEGSEYDVMQDVAFWAENGLPIARQVTVEYHAHCGIYPHGFGSFEPCKAWHLLTDTRLQRAGYDLVFTEGIEPPCSRHHWTDSLYVLRDIP